MTQCDLTTLKAWLRSGAWISAPDHQVWLGWGEPKKVAKPSPSTPYFWVPDFYFQEAAPYWAFEHTALVSLESMKASLLEYLGPDSSSDAHELKWTEARSPDFEAAFRELQNAFQDGVLKKAVPVVSDKAEWPSDRAKIKANWILNAIQYAGSAPVYLYGAWDSDSGILGATPELLIEKTGQSWASVALAGTRRDSERESKPPLLDDPKELREHCLVIDGVTESLSPFGKVSASPTREAKLPGLSHLKTEIRLEASTPCSMIEIAQALHPTPALGTSPRDCFRKVLSQLDERLKTDRRRFGAPFGFSSAEPAFSRAVVAIRNLQWDPSAISASAGCGVIAESKLDSEWLELRAKLAAAKRIFKA